MKRLADKIKKENGETLAETLVAALILSIGLLLMASMILAGRHNITAGQKKMDALYREMNALEKISEGASPESIKTDNTQKLQTLGLTVNGTMDVQVCWEAPTTESSVNFYIYRKKQ